MDFSKEIAAMRKRAEQFSNASLTERLAMSGALSPEVIARNKAAYGITS